MQSVIRSAMYRSGCGVSRRFSSISPRSFRSFTRLFSDTICQKTEKEMMGAFQEMNQAESLVKRGAYPEAEQLYNRVNDIVSSFSPANSPMIDVINRKKLEIYFHANPAQLFSTMKTMRSNVESRGDKDEAVLECLQFATLSLHQGKTSESGVYLNALTTLCGNDNSLASFVTKLLQSLQQHLTGGENMYQECLKLKDLASSHGDFWKLLTLNNTLGMMWESESDVSEGMEVTKEIMSTVQSMESANAIRPANSDIVRQTLNNAGSYLLAREKIAEGGEALKYSLKLSDAQHINMNQNMVSSNTLGMMGSILLKEDQPVTCEGMYLQALEVYQKKEKTASLKAFSRPELFDYSTMCQGYSNLLLKWDKRESLGSTYQQKATDLLMMVGENADWEIPLSSRYWIPSMFKWDLNY